MLSQFLITQIFAFLLVFCRLGSAMMLLPGFAEAFVLMRARLLLALFFSLILSQVLVLPPMPTTMVGLVHVMGAEILIGLFMGAMVRLLINAIQISGGIIAYQSSLSSALTQDITNFQAQDTSLGNLLSMTAVVLLFVTDLHHLMLRGLADSYSLFAPGQIPLMDDMAEQTARTASNMFKMAMQIAAPSIIVGMMLYLGAGIIARLMPNIQIFFLLVPPQLLISFIVLSICISSMMLWYMDFFKESLAAFLAPG